MVIIYSAQLRRALQIPRQTICSFRFTPLEILGLIHSTITLRQYTAKSSLHRLKKRLLHNALEIGYEEWQV